MEPRRRQCALRQLVYVRRLILHVAQHSDISRVACEDERVIWRSNLVGLVSSCGCFARSHQLPNCVLLLLSIPCSIDEVLRMFRHRTLRRNLPERRSHRHCAPSPRQHKQLHFSCPHPHPPTASWQPETVLVTSSCCSFGKAHSMARATQRGLECLNWASTPASHLACAVQKLRFGMHVITISTSNLRTIRKWHSWELSR